MSEGYIFNIQKFCINDGPGIRTTVFFKGCPLSCKWCHNPESHKGRPELLFSSDKCVFCRKCADVCQSGVHSFSDRHILQREKCTVCGKCEAVCPASALETAGRLADSEEVIRTVLRDKAFFENSGGGITLSGGEPFMQFGFMTDILKKAKENGLHTCIETSGYTDKEKLTEAAGYTDIFLYDWKLSDSSMHKSYTGVSNERILSNLFSLEDTSSSVILRCPVIPGVNDNEEHFRTLAEIAQRHSKIIRIDIAPYHELGLSKLSRMGKTASQVFSVPDKNEEDMYIETVRRYTDVPVRRM